MNLIDYIFLTRKLQKKYLIKEYSCLLCFFEKINISKTISKLFHKYIIFSKKQ